MKLEQSENMVVYMDAIKHLHSHISKLDRQNHDNLELHQEMTMNYIQKLTHAADKLHSSTTTIKQNLQIHPIDKSLEDERVEIPSDIPMEVYNLRVDNEELKTTQEDLLTQMRSIEDENQQYREDLDDLQLKYQTALQDNEMLKLKYQNIIQDLENCYINSRNITTQCEEKESEIYKLKEQISQLRSKLETIIEENNHLIKEQNYPQETLSSAGYNEAESVKKILSNQSQHQKYIDELEKRIENYDFIIQTIGTDGHFTHLFLMIGESIRALEEKLRDAYDQIAILRWNALVDENLTKMAKNCLKEMHDKLDESRNETTIRELMNTIHQLEDHIQIIKKDRKNPSNYSSSNYSQNSAKYDYKSESNSFKPEFNQHSTGISKTYTTANVQTTSINLVTGDAYIQTGRSWIGSFSKNLVLELDIECTSISQNTGIDNSTFDSVKQDTITSAHVEVHTGKEMEKDNKNYNKDFSRPSQHLFSFRSLMQANYKSFGKIADNDRFHDSNATGRLLSEIESKSSYNTVYSSPCTSQYVIQSSCTCSSVPQRYSYRGSSLKHTIRPRDKSRQVVENLKNMSDLICDSKSRTVYSNNSSRKIPQTNRPSHKHSSHGVNSEYIEQEDNYFISPGSRSIKNHLSTLRGSRVNERNFNQPGYSKNYSLRGASTTPNSYQHGIAQTSMPNYAGLRGTILNHQHYQQRDLYSWRGAPKINHGINNNDHRSLQKNVESSNDDSVYLQRYINLGGIYSFPKKTSKEQLLFNADDQLRLKESLYSDRGMDDTPLRRQSSSNLQYPPMNVLNEVVTLKRKLADFENKAAENLANLKKQYERNAKCLVDEHNRSVSKLSVIQDETIRQLENENDKLRNEVHYLLQKLTNCGKSIESLSSVSTGKIDIPPNHKTMHAMHLQNKKILIKTEAEQKILKNIKGGCENVCDLKKVQICDKLICYHDDLSCTDSIVCFPEDDCGESCGDCGIECACVCLAEKATQTKPMPRTKIAATRSMANILTKFLYEGLQRLDIFELSKMHSRICYAAQTLIETEKESKMSQEEKTLYQIVKMEDKLIRKQKSAQEKLKLLELCMRQEKQRICVMRADIETEKCLVMPSQSFGCTENHHECHATQVCLPIDCECNTPLEPCASDPCKPKSILKTCLGSRKPESVIVCPEPCTTNLICTPETSGSISTKMIDDSLDPLTPKTISKDGCALSTTHVLDEPCRDKNEQEEISEQCQPLISYKSSKSTSALCQPSTLSKRNTVSCGPRSTSVLCGLTKSTITPDYVKCADILPKNQSKFPYIRVPTKYRIEEKTKDDKQKECVCIKKDKSRPASTRTCCGCREKDFNKILGKNKKLTMTGNIDFLAKCAPSLYKKLSKRKS